MAPSRAAPALWTCPDCGNKFVTRNMPHSCAHFSHADHLKAKGPAARALYDRLREVVEACGPVTEVANKARYGWMVRARFVGVVSLSDRGMTVGFWLKRRINSPRFTKVDHYLRDDYVYTLRVKRPEEIDNEVAGWVREAYAVGAQTAILARNARTGTERRRRTFK